jgi:hypothetical protein
VRRVDFCPHCGNRTPQTQVHSQRFSAIAWRKDGNISEDRRFIGEQYVLVCGTCEQLLVYVDYQIEPEHLALARAELVYPEQDELDSAVPEVVALIYEEAARIQTLAPNAYAVQVRRALEAICDDRGVRRGSLHERLRELTSQGVIPPVLSEMTDVLRIIGNIGAHHSAMVLAQPDVWAIRQFFLAIVEYVYVGPRKLKEFQDRLAEIKAPSPRAAT